MGKKIKSVYVLIVLLLLLSLACNLPHAESQFGDELFCKLTGGRWVPYAFDVPDGPYICDRLPPAEREDPAAAAPAPLEGTALPLQTAEPSDTEPVKTSQPVVPADISACATYDSLVNYVNVAPRTTVRYAACDAQLAVTNYSSEPMMVVYHLVVDNDPAAGPEEVWKDKRLEPGEQVLVDDLFTSKWNNGEYYYRKVLEIGMIRMVPECEQFYINLNYQEPPFWYAQVAKPAGEFSCP